MDTTEEEGGQALAIHFGRTLWVASIGWVWSWLAAGTGCESGTRTKYASAFDDDFCQLDDASGLKRSRKEGCGDAQADVR